jgi:hypothetical protein
MFNENNCDLIKRTKAACDLNCINPDYNELICFLTSQDKSLICYSLLNIEKIQNREDADIVIVCLNNPDSRIREFSSGLIVNNLIIPETRCFFDRIEYINILVESIKDINPKVCRNIMCALQRMSNKVEIIEKLIKIIEEGNTFTVYWGLYAIENLLVLKDVNPDLVSEKIINLIKKTSESKEYQIRERTAFIVKVLHEKLVKRYNVIEELEHLIKNLSNDENFYVRHAVSKE